MNLEMKKLIVCMKEVGRRDNNLELALEAKSFALNDFRNSQSKSNQMALDACQHKVDKMLKDLEDAKSEARQAFEAALLTAED